MLGSWFLLPVMVVCHLHFCPLTKVEESFNVQAAHDLLSYGWDLRRFDHFEFPGVVPRTFLGPLVLATLTKPLTWFTDDKFLWLLFIRLWLGTLVGQSFQSFSQSVRNRFGYDTAKWLPVVVASQFHFCFYATRTLPNIFALIPTLLAVANLLRHQYSRAIWWATSVVVIFRSELLLLFGPLFIPHLLSGRLSFIRAVKHGLLATLTSLLVTVVIDSYFWQSWIWPEGQVWFYNVVLGKSVNWGTSPFHWYFSSALPRAFGLSLLFVIAGCFQNKNVFMSVSAPALMFISLYSFLAHKELRFIIYAIPLLSVSGAKAVSNLWNSQKFSVLSKMIVGTVLAGNLALSSGFLYISAQNYPGGAALMQLHQKVNSANLSVHIDVFTAQTGVSRFLQTKSDWTYDKTEGLAEGSVQLRRFDVLFIGTPNGNADAMVKLYAESHDVVHRQAAFAKVDWSALKGNFRWPVVLMDKVVVLRRKTSVK